MSQLRAMQRQLADALRSEAMPRVTSLRSDSLADGASRLAIYHHGYRVRLRDALATEFPGLALLAGRRFAAMLDQYIATHPSTHFNIRWHGDGLSSFLATTPPWRDQPGLAEMAALDWAISTTFDAADHHVVEMADLEGVPPQAWPGLRFHPLPHARLLHLSYNVDAFRRAADRAARRPRLRRLRQPRTLLIWRPTLDVRYRTVPGNELPALQGALDGLGFADLCERHAEHVSAEATLPHLLTLLRQWLGEGLIGRLELG